MRALGLFVCWSVCGVVSLSADEPVHLAMGIKIGEVTQDSAIVWTRVTRNPRANGTGRADRQIVGQVKGKPDEQPIWDESEVNQLVGSVPGAAGRVRISVSEHEDFADPIRFDWQEVQREEDYTRQARVTGLRPKTRYHVKVEAAPTGVETPTATVNGMFQTPASPADWQDVSFGVITGMMYRDLDHAEGFEIFPSMQKLGIDFLVPTGDTVYYDNEAPRARTVAMARYHWHRIYSLPRLVQFHKQIPAYWEKDDHDTLSDDAWSTLHPKMMLPLTWEDGLKLFPEQVPMGDKTYRTIRWGQGLQVWLVEGRDFRSPNTAPDGPEKTIWGKEQLAWLQESILASDATFRVLVSPTPIVGPDRKKKRDNHSNESFAYEGNLFRNWTRENQLTNFFVCCGDRHWQYHSVDPATGLQEFSCGPASDQHAGGTPGHDMMVQPFHRVRGGFLTVNVFRDEGNRPQLEMRHHDVSGKIVYRYRAAD